MPGVLAPAQGTLRGRALGALGTTTHGPRVPGAPRAILVARLVARDIRRRRAAARRHGRTAGNLRAVPHRPVSARTLRSRSAARIWIVVVFADLLLGLTGGPLLGSSDGRTGGDARAPRSPCHATSATGTGFPALAPGGECGTQQGPQHRDPCSDEDTHHGLRRSNDHTNTRTAISPGARTGTQRQSRLSASAMPSPARPPSDKIVAPAFSRLGG